MNKYQKFRQSVVTVQLIYLDIKYSINIPMTIAKPYVLQIGIQPWNLGFNYWKKNFYSIGNSLYNSINW